VPVSGSAQGHVETRRRKAKVTYCHWKLLCPEELDALLMYGQKLGNVFEITAVFPILFNQGKGA
jgi:hypothetical protein